MKTKILLLSALLIGACAHDPRTASSPDGIRLGMTLSEVMRAHGTHYRPFPGPRNGDVALVYDDITVHVRRNRLLEMDGLVRLVETTTPPITEWVAQVPYTDARIATPGK